MTSVASSSMAADARPPAGYRVLPVSPGQILLPLTVSNKCGQAFRWRGIDVWEPEEDVVAVKTEPVVKKEEGDDEEEEKTATRTRTTRWTKWTEWSVCLSDRVVLLRQDVARQMLYYRTLVPPKTQPSGRTAEEIDVETGVWLRDYLNVDVPLEDLYVEWAAKDAVFARFATRFSGVRMLRQDPWECLCAFICSSNNNIARIGQMVQNLCTHFSEPLLSHTYPRPPPGALAWTTEEADAGLETGDVVVHYHPFPSPERLAQPDVEETLRRLSFGYRARYIALTAQMLCQAHSSDPGLARAQEEEEEEEEEEEKRPRYPSVQAYLASLRTLPYAEARQELLQLPGVGPKVADCILLMSMDQPSSIPVDRHVFQFAERWYGIRTARGATGHKAYEMIADRFRALWGEYAGWAHSVLFTADLRAFKEYGVVKTEVKEERPQQQQQQQQQQQLGEAAAVKEETRAETKGEEHVNVNGTATHTVVVQNGSMKRVKKEERTITESFPGDKGGTKRVRRSTTLQVKQGQ